ncbi:hypothetical protein CSAL01_05662 [Colletotrichum salicis]|uniref:Uncharacterized protein n=1 Tax=Colletotrichum salicis TaxID=1209931 RepID=A0A135V1S0_9PEZI|nr:hypothetical protein CSAL01_05662 [Colletotrichum salicis]
MFSPNLQELIASFERAARANLAAIRARHSAAVPRDVPALYSSVPKRPAVPTGTGNAVHYGQRAGQPAPSRDPARAAQLPARQAVPQNLRAALYPAGQKPPPANVPPPAYSPSPNQIAGNYVTGVAVKPCDPPAAPRPVREVAPVQTPIYNIETRHHVAPGNNIHVHTWAIREENVNQLIPKPGTMG